MCWNPRLAYCEVTRKVLWVSKQPCFDLPYSNTKHEVSVLRFGQPLFNEHPGTSVLVQISENDERGTLGCSVPTEYGTPQIAESTSSIRCTDCVTTIQVVENSAKNRLAQLVLDGDVNWNYVHSNKSS